MRRVVCVSWLVFLALNAATSDVSAQSLATGSCESILLRAGAQAGRPFLGLKECYNCHTSGFPKDGFGEQFGILANDSWILGNEVKTWGTQDKHSQAYTSLLSETAKTMGIAMGVPGNIHRDKRCLACHSGFPISDMAAADGLIDEEKYREDLRITAGVSCEGCHGSAGGEKGWLSAHASKETWRFLKPHEKCEKGYSNVRSVISRTQICLSCHLGNAVQGRILTHEMYAAGHPPLPAFELETFENLMPRHWRHLNEKSDLHKEYSARTETAFHPDELRGTRALLVAALISQSEALRLTANLAEGSISEEIPKPQWPDFAQFDCYACHHDLKSESWRMAAQFRGSPGRPRLVPWPTVLSRLAAVQALTDSGDLKRDLSSVQSATLQSPFGNRERLIEAARSAAESAEQTAASLSPQVLTASDGVKLLERISETAELESLDYDSARQLLWAFTVVRNELHQRSVTVSENPLLSGDLTALNGMFVLDLRDGRQRTDRIPGATQTRLVTEVDLSETLPPIAQYDARAFQRAFAELRNGQPPSAELVK